MTDGIKYLICYYLFHDSGSLISVLALSFYFSSFLAKTQSAITRSKLTIDTLEDVTDV